MAIKVVVWAHALIVMVGGVAMGSYARYRDSGVAQAAPEGSAHIAADRAERPTRRDGAK